MKSLKNISPKKFPGNGVIKKHKKLWIVLAVVFILLIGFGVVRGNMSKKQRQMMQDMNQPEIAEIERRNLMSTISATGSIVSSESKEISVSLSNVEVESVNYQVGDMINEGDILCTFDSEDIQKSLSQAKASLNVTTTKSQMDVTSSERSLNEAVESSNIEQARIDADTADALNEYNESIEDTADAKSAYENAQKTAASYKEQLNAAAAEKTALENNKTKLETYKKDFEDARDNVTSLIQEINNNITKIEYVTDEISDFYNLEITSTETLEKSNIYKIADGQTVDTDTTEKLDGYISNMKKARDDYNALTTQIGQIDQIDKKIADKTKQVADLQENYASAVKTEETLKNAYEQASSAEDNKYDAYVKSARSQEDTARNNASTIANKTDNVTTSKLNASTSGTSDKNQVESYEEQLEDCTVIAPISGVITALNIEKGDTYSGSALATIEDISSYKISTQISEYDIVDIKAGQKVVIKTNGTGDLELDGTVESIAPRATTSSGGNSSEVTYEVTITVDTPCEDLKLDMTAKLSIILESKENVLTVPYDAVAEDENGDLYIEVQEADGNMPTKRIYITKGIESDYYIEVIGDEITEGMKVTVPRMENSQSIQGIMMMQGPMGGF